MIYDHIFSSPVNNRSLRLTNILKSNDSMEISWICRYYDAEFKRAYENASDLFRSKISSERLMGYVKLFTDEFFNENHADFRYYVTCFSYQNDLLSQWRGYADPADLHGIIGFQNICQTEGTIFQNRIQ